MVDIKNYIEVVACTYCGNSHQKRLKTNQQHHWKNEI